jgi:hypothetical protein
MHASIEKLKEVARRDAAKLEFPFDIDDAYSREVMERAAYRTPLLEEIAEKVIVLFDDPAQCVYLCDRIFEDLYDMYQILALKERYDLITEITK